MAETPCREACPLPERRPEKGSALPPGAREIVFSVSGMSCAACAARIEKVLSRLPGVFEAAVNFAAATARVVYAPQQISPEEMAARLKEEGYELNPLSSSQETVRIGIGGMTCAACVARLEKVLGRLSGVKEVQINLAANQGTITFDPAQVGLSDFRRAIEEEGYQFLGLLGEEVAAESSEEARLRELRKKLVLAWVLAPAIFASP